MQTYRAEHRLPKVCRLLAKEPHERQPFALWPGSIYERLEMLRRNEPNERQQLVEALAGLAGVQEGPKNTFIDGTCYEYDCKVKRTFEVAPSGRRFPVALVAGMFQRDSAKPASDKAAR